ncbi:hypothetical protein BGZ95_011501 [Linnemannia exigua]|uniref:Uncharacterized protein n=1 Tax=Linnemannia exigua TaxID=604196 RepID=A0AAD4H5K6_9FUNG|nr:hypothetical protein BGZ95_011501 [Linnemannia exigua]
MPGSEHSGAATSGFFGDNSGSSMTPGRVFSRRGVDDLDVEPAPEDPNIVQLGRIFAWICTVFYLSSRMPQLWKNFTRKSVQGLSILMFFWAAMGNLSYTLSILNSAEAVNPETSRTFLLKSVPALVDEEDPDVIEASSSPAQQGQHVQVTDSLSPFHEELVPADHHLNEQHQQQEVHGSDTRSPLL